MKYKQFTSFIRGMFEKEGLETRISDQALLKLHNVDLDISGRLKRRRGYTYWADLKDDNSVPANVNDVEIPKTDGTIGFGKKVQSIFSFVDVAGVEYIVIISNGKVFIETLLKNEKVWTCLNPSGNIDIAEKSKHIQKAHYLDSLFFNDKENNVLMYNSQEYADGGWISISSRFIYFAKDTIYLRNYSDFSQLTSEDIKIENVVTNVQGKLIYDSLVNIGYILPVGGIITDPANLRLGYMLRVGSADWGFHYYVLDNGSKERRAVDKCWLIKMNDRFIAQNFIELTMQPNSEVINFTFYEGYIYIWCKDGEIHKIDENFLPGIIGAGTDVADLEAPENDDGIKQYSIAVNENGIFVYSEKLPNKDDWWQPIILDKLNFEDDTGNFTNGINKVNDVSETQEFLFAKELITQTELSKLIQQYYYRKNEETLRSVQYFFEAYHGSPSEEQMYCFTGALREKLYWTPSGEWDQLWPGWPLGFYDQKTSDWPEIPELPASLYFDLYFRHGHKLISSIENELISTKINCIEVKNVAWLINGQYQYLETQYKKKFDLDYYMPPVFDENGQTIRDHAGKYDFDHLVYRYPNEFYIAYQFKYYCSFTQTYQTVGPAVYVINETGEWGTLLNIYGWRQSLLFDLTKKKITFHPNFHYDKNLTVPVDKQLWIYFGDSQNFTTDFITNSKLICVGHGYKNEEIIRLTTTVTLPAPLQPNTNYYVVNKTDNDFEVKRSLEEEIIGLTSDGVGVQSMALVSKEFRTNGSYCYLWNTTFDSSVFTDITTPKYALLLGLDLEGNLKTKVFDGINDDKTWRYLIPLGLLTELKNIVPLQIFENKLYFGTSMLNGIDTEEDNGKYMKLDLSENDSEFDFEMKKCEKSDRRIMIQGDPRWLLYHKEGVEEHFKVNSQWIWEYEGFAQYHNYTDLLLFNSNLSYHIHKQQENITEATKDKLRYLGTPKSPIVSMDYDLTATFIQGTKLIYYMLFKFYGEKTTMLSAPSEEITIPQLHASQDFTVDVGNDKIQCVGHLYVNNDIIHVSSTDTLPPPLQPDTDYWVINKTDNDFEISLEEAGNKIDILIGEAGTHSMIQMNDQPVKIVVSELNLKNAIGQYLYDIEDIEEIHIYRAQQNRKKIYMDAILIYTLGKTAGEFTPDFYEDKQQTYTYSPFTESNVAKYPCKNIVVHKNRLVLINRTDLINSNVIQYSAIDLAQAISADNIRAIQSGDGDSLVAGESIGDYLFLFKKTKIYAILGDVSVGQLIDVDLKLGTPYADSVISFDNVIYFMNENSIYRIVNLAVQNIGQTRLDNYFDKYRDDCIDFVNAENNVLAYIDKGKKEVKFFVPQKREGHSQEKNNLVIVYDIRYDFFRTYEFSDNIFDKAQVSDIITKETIELMTDYEGKIFKISADKNDDDNMIKYVIRTKAFNVDSNFRSKIFKMLKIFGKYIEKINISYFLDGVKKVGSVSLRKGMDGKEEAFLKLWGQGQANSIVIELSGQTFNDPPFEIDEMLLGYDDLQGIMR